jgi:large subunit ribosomal protein L29
MKINKIREMSSPDLEKELGELKSELFKLRFSLATNGLDNPMKIKEVKKDIAKIKTVLTQRELNGEEVKAPKKEEKVEAKAETKKTTRKSTKKVEESK